jgi:hypothetical protein
MGESGPPEPQNQKAARSKVGIARFVVLAVGMLAATGFNNYLVLVVHEVRNPRAKRNQSEKLKVGELSRAQQLPELALGIRQAAPQAKQK